MNNIAYFDIAPLKNRITGKLRLFDGFFHDSQKESAPVQPEASPSTGHRSNAGEERSPTIVTLREDDSAMRTLFYHAETQKRYHRYQACIFYARPVLQGQKKSGRQLQIGTQ
ncbi:hypothetical protein PoB_006805000 [Plakobranchus ocellatus]|uniref:Uncharacterized protein n=1 Tax=Plakobranchus ocellatus TaxID=259542 RepID=A0AAV4DBS3_9GAST|nr:hypothetical protein PoB_006805000 [Plakobranchus ocellatus]